jgi:hypothetical protein
MLWRGKYGRDGLIRSLIWQDDANIIRNVTKLLMTAKEEKLID